MIPTWECRATSVQRQSRPARENRFGIGMTSTLWGLASVGNLHWFFNAFELPAALMCVDDRPT